MGTKNLSLLVIISLWFSCSAFAEYSHLRNPKPISDKSGRGYYGGKSSSQKGSYGRGAGGSSEEGGSQNSASSGGGGMGGGGGGEGAQYESKRSELQEEFGEMGKAAQEKIEKATEEHAKSVQKMTQGFQKNLKSLQVSDKQSNKYVKEAGKVIESLKDDGSFSSLIEKNADATVKAIQQLSKTQVEMVRQLGQQYIVPKKDPSNDGGHTIAEKAQSEQSGRTSSGGIMAQAMGAHPEGGGQTPPPGMIEQPYQHDNDHADHNHGMRGFTSNQSSAFEGVSAQTYNYPPDIKLRLK